jgi:hypothetical protein
MAIGGTNADGSQFVIPVQDAANLLDSSRFAFYVEQPGAGRVWLRVVRPLNRAAYLRSEADSMAPNNLDNLPEADRSVPL